MVITIVTIVFALIIVFSAGRLINLSFMEKSAIDGDLKKEMEIEQAEDGNLDGNEDISEQNYSLEDVSVKKSFGISASH